MTATPESAASSGSASNVSTWSSLKSCFASVDLVIRKQPPSHVFADEWFGIEVTLEPTKLKGEDQGKSFERVVEFVPTLRKPNGQAVPAENGASLVTNPHTVRFHLTDTPPMRRESIRCKIGTTNPPEKDMFTSYVIHLMPKASSDPIISNIAAVSTGSICTVNYKIDITPEAEWQPVWYKDEGGQDKAMIVTAGLVDKQNRPVTGKAVPLQLTLYYKTQDHPIRVNNQDKLRLGEEKFSIDEITGKTEIKFRIEDVSKNHQGQAFVVEVAPSLEARGFKDIGPGFTPAVSVRSKRNKRQRKARGEARPQQWCSPAHYPTSSFLPEPIPPRSTESPFIGADIVGLRDAMKGIFQWVDEVVNGLYPLQWYVIGYARHPDGSPDYAHPYHNMPNPNKCISRVLAMYSAETRDHLRTILNAIEAATPLHCCDDSYQGGTSLTIGSGFRELQENVAMMRGGMAPGLPYLSLPAQSASAANPSSLPDLLGYPISFGPGPYQTGQMPQVAARGPPLPPQVAALGPPLPHHSTTGPAMAPPMGGPTGHTSLLQEMGMRAKEVHACAASVPSPIQEVPEEECQVNLESRGGVAYVLARNFKSLRTGQRLGFPAYSLSKELLGFYNETSQGVGFGQFVPISSYADEFGPTQMTESTQILDDAMSKKSQEVYAVKDWGSIASLIDHALVYAWSKDIDQISTNDSHASSDGCGADC